MEDPFYLKTPFKPLDNLKAAEKFFKTLRKP